MTDGRASRNNLSLDTSFTLNVYSDTQDSGSPFHDSSTERPNVIFPRSPRTPVTPSLVDTPIAPPQSNNRARNESRKLLSHVLIQLANRKKPESVLDSIRTTQDAVERSFEALADALKEAVKIGRPVPPPEEIDDESDDVFTTDNTINLIVQLMEVLTISVSQGWQIFEDSPQGQDYQREVNRDSRLPSPFRRSRSAGKRSRSSSPNKGNVHVPELLSLCVSVLKSIVSEDCRYRVAVPRPSRPPNSLQFLTLNIAQFLIHSHRHNPRVISQIAFAMIPACYTFSTSMQPRLLLFFESVVVRIVLDNLEHVQGLSMKTFPPEISSDMPFNDSFDQQENPVVSIQIDEVQGELPSSQAGKKWALNPKPMGGQVQSTNNPRQSPHIYYLSFLISPLLGAMMDSFDSTARADANIEVSHRFISLLKLIANSKLDAYNDLLEIIAYRGTKSRRFAIAALARVWPKSIGHTIISSSFCLFDYDGETSLHTPTDPYAHQFMPWHFDSAHRHFNVGKHLHDDCRSCLKPITGFALVCPFCMTAVHFDCYEYPAGNYQIQYSMFDDLGAQRIAMYRFSGLEIKGNFSSHVMTADTHKFKPANWFTLCLCFACHKPLWGCISQGWKCAKCPISLHHKCIPSFQSLKPCGAGNFTSKEMTINWGDLRGSCLDHFPVLQYTPDQLNGYNYEEIDIFHCVLKTQLQLLNNGIEYGSIVIVQNGRNATNHVDQKLISFELHQVTETCKQLLDSGTLVCSPMTQQYVQDTDAKISKPSIMYSWSYLEYITAAIKTSFPQSRHLPRTVPDLLDVGFSTDVGDEGADTVSYPFESAPVSHIRNILAVDFNLHSDDSAQYLLSQLHHISLIERVDRNPLPFKDIDHEKDVKCVFPLPLGLDLSMNVETLVSSVEAALTDLDLSTNEFGFLLLTRRFWPNGLASEYGLKRLAGRVVTWVLDEDDSLVIILREFAGNQKPLPGVRTDRISQPWPSLSDFRPGLASLNGGDYVVARRALLFRFALPWLLELHNLHPQFYCQIIFDASIQAAVDRDPTELLDQPNGNQNFSNRCDTVLRSIIKLCQFSLVFTVFDDLFIRWMDLLFELDQVDKPMPSLPRLWGESDTTQRASFVVDPTSAPSEVLSDLDPLKAISNLAGQSPDGLSRSLRYLSGAVKSGVNIPTASFRQFLTLLLSNQESIFENANMFVRAIVLSLWQRSLGRQDLQGLLSSLHARLAPKISESLISGGNTSISLSIVRQSLGACLRLYGCERSSILAAGLIASEDAQQLLSRRKFTNRGSMVIDPVIIEPEILRALQLYLQSNSADVSCLLAKFLSMFIMQSPFLEGFEVDNFILRNGKLIALCAWAVYDIQQEDVAISRTNLVLRSLLVDSEHFQDILRTNMDPSRSPVEIRLSSVNRLFRMISDVTSPAFDVEGRQWRSSVIEIFYFFFSALWADPNEEIRLAVRSSSATLLPGHFDIISHCWNESLAKAPINERIRLVGFLIQLRPHFPSWKALTWDNIINTLVEYDYDPKSIQKNDTTYTDKDVPRLSSAEPDSAHLRASIVLLSLQMIADGIEIDNFSIMKLKVQFLQVIGFNRISLIPTQSGQSFHLQFGEVAEISESAYPCIEQLGHVMDAPHYAKLHHAALGTPEGSDDKIANVLVGSIFLDASLLMLGTVRNLQSLPVLTLKCVLEMLYIIIHKYDFDDQLFRHLQPLLRQGILRVMELLSTDISYELRQLSLSIAQASIKKWHSLLGATVSIILELIATEIASQTRTSQDSLFVHGKLLIGNTLQSFCNHGLLLSLMRRSLRPDFFTVLYQISNAQGKEASVAPQAICDPLLRDTLARAVECDSASFQQVLQNLASFIDTVYNQGYTPDLIIFTGQHLTALVRRVSDGTIEHADPSPLIVISAVLMKNNKRHMKELLPYVDTVIRVALNRLRVDSSTLNRLIKAAPTPRSNVQESAPGTIDVINVLFDVLLDGLRMKTKMPPLTLKSLIECLILNEESNPLPLASTHSRLFWNTVDDAYIFLQNYVWHEENIDHDFQAVVASGKLLLRSANQDPTVFQRLTEEKSARFPLGIRSWNVLLLVTLQEGHDDWISMIFSSFSTFINTYSTLLRSYVLSGIPSSISATTDVNQAHISMKLWLMVVKSMSKLGQDAETIASAIWNELWPAYEVFLNVLETESQFGLHTTLISLASASAADLLIFVNTLKISLALDASIHITILNRLQLLNRGDSSSSKMARAIRIIAEPCTNIVSNSVMLDQIAKELVAAEKIRLVESKRDNANNSGRGGIGGDRFRQASRI